jgi:uncharacterized membrane protein
MNLHKVTKIAAIVISVLSLAFLGGLMASSGETEDNSWISPLIYLSYIILIATVLVVLIYVLKNLFTHKEDLKKTMVFIGMFLGLILISFILADGTEVKSATNEIIASESTSKWVSTGLNMFYLLAIVAIGTMFWTGFNKIKK